VAALKPRLNIKKFFADTWVTPPLNPELFKCGPKQRPI
jgi:hypothetical protein